MLPAKIEAAGRLIERVGIDENRALTGLGPRRAVEALHGNRDRGVRRHVDRNLCVVEPFVKVVEPGGAEPRVLPPRKPCGNLVESRTDRVADEEVVRRDEIGGPQQRPARQMVEIEGTARGVAHDAPAQPVDDLATLVKVCQERYGEAEEPHLGSRNAADDGNDFGGLSGQARRPSAPPRPQAKAAILQEKRQRHATTAPLRSRCAWYAVQRSSTVCHLPRWPNRGCQISQYDSMYVRPTRRSPEAGLSFSSQAHKSQLRG